MYLANSAVLERFTTHCSGQFYAASRHCPQFCAGQPVIYLDFDVSRRSHASTIVCQLPFEQLQQQYSLNHLQLTTALALREYQCDLYFCASCSYVDRQSRLALSS